MAERIRRSSTSSSWSRTQQQESTRLSDPNVFSDEYALDSSLMGDGFGPPRPIDVAHNPHAGSSGILQPTPTNGPAETPAHRTYDHAAASIRRSSSSRKSGYNERRSSLLSRSDGVRQFPLYGTRASVSSNERPTSTLFRSGSRASNSTMPRTQSPYQGATGPSRPYGMYPQDIGVLRTSSTATTSTVRPQERSYTGPTGPTQPYGMYPQNTVAEDEIGPVQTLHPPVSVGFPGRTQDYRRRLGPDGEDVDDLIGPDGYAEQLPPYTRYPDGIPPKREGPGPASILSADRGQQGSSEETLANPFRSRDSLPQHTESHPNSTEVTAVAGSESQQEDEGGNFKERVKEKSKKRVCFGVIPLWVIAMLVILLVAVLAGVIGAVVGRARGEKQAATEPQPFHRPSPQSAAPATVVVTTTSLVDATPLPSTPTNLPTLPTGTFYVPLRTIAISNNSCLTAHTDAWGCSNKADLKLDLSVPKMVSVSPRFPPTANQIQFGPQSPQLSQPVALTLMGDKDGMEKGPAWFFQEPFTKVVVVPGKVWDNGDRSIKRWSLWGDRRNSRRSADIWYGGIAPASAKPWFCYWNNTILEGFIYVTQNSSGSTQSVSSEYHSPSSPTGYFDPPATASSVDGKNLPFAAISSFPSPDSAMPTGSSRKRQTSDPDQLAAYSKDVKIEERRDPNNGIQPYCVHMQIMNDGTAQPLPEPSITLTETEPDYDQSNYQSNRLRQKRGDLWEREDSSTSACECEWVSS